MPEFWEAITRDGVTLRGTVWSGSENWIVLIHDLGEDLDTWRPLHRVLARTGCSRLAVDLRGHGASDGARQEDHVGEDIDVALGAVRKCGAERICLVSAGFPALVALGMNQWKPDDGMVLLSPGPLRGRDVGALRGQPTRKIFLVGSGRQTFSSATNKLRNVSIGWAYSVSFPTEAEGSALLVSEFGVHVKEHISGFLAEHVARR